MKEEERIEANQVLMDIEQPTLTDEEALLLSGSLELKNIFSDISTILQKRGSEGGALEKLKALALLNGIYLNVQKQYKSNILIGAVLE